MNRQQRRSAARQKGKPFDRTALIANAVDFLASTTDETITGATLVMPDGEVIYLAADAASKAAMQ